MSLQVSTQFMIPVQTGQAVSQGWTSKTAFRPQGITWHWTATRTLLQCSQILGGANASRKGEASAHYGVGRSLAEGVHQYVSLDNRSWHAGINQTLRWDGKARLLGWEKGAGTTIGIETVNIGFERQGFPAGPDWMEAASPNGKQVMKIQPWPEEQIQMMIELGKIIVAKFPNICPENHHGHHDICPGYKVDVAAFPFARILRGIYDDPSIPDVWSPYWLVKPRQQALIDLGYSLGPDGADGDWGRMSDAALRKFQRENGLVEDGMWTTFVNWAIHAKLNP